MKITISSQPSPSDLSFAKTLAEKILSGKLHKFAIRILKKKPLLVFKVGIDDPSRHFIEQYATQNGWKELKDKETRGKTKEAWVKGQESIVLYRNQMVPWYWTMQVSVHPPVSKPKRR